jgi:predicted transcriptional regulator
MPSKKVTLKIPIDLLTDLGSYDACVIYHALNAPKSVNDLMLELTLPKTVVEFYLKRLFEKGYIENNLLGYVQSIRNKNSSLKPKGNPYHSKYVALWNDFLVERIGTGIKNTWKDGGIEAKALKELIVKLDGLFEGDAERSLYFFEVLLNHFDILPEFYRKYNLVFWNRHFADILGYYKVEWDKFISDERKINESFERFFGK